MTSSASGVTIDADGAARVDVTVVLACYTEERLDSLRAALMSLKRQTHDPQCVIVAVDNNSYLADLIRLEFEWVKVTENCGGRGASYTRNRGVDAVDTDFVAFLDDDETADETWLFELIQPFEDLGVVGTGGAYVPVWDGSKPQWFPDEFAWVVGGAYTGLPLETAVVRNVWSGSMAVRTDDFRRVGGFRTDFGKQGTVSQPEDTDLCIRMADATGKHWMYVPSAVIFHEVPAGRASFGFFLRRCFSEGAGKAAMRANLDRSAISTEHDYVRATVAAALGRFAGRPKSAIQGMVMLLGLASAAIGYAVGIFRQTMV